MAEKVPTVDLLQFTFGSLFFCGTPIETMRGSRFLIAVNDWYMTFIRAGWAVPLAFVIDVSTMLLHPGTGFRNRWKENHPDEVKQVSLNYYKMLQGLRRQPICEAVVELLGSIRDETRRNQATKVFLRFLLAEMSHFHDTYAFNSRSLKILSARPTAEGIPKMQLVLDGKRRQLDVQFYDPGRVAGKNEFGTIADMMRALTDYYTTHRLEEFISAEEWLMVEIVARSQAGIGRVDFRFLQELLGGWELRDVEEHEPRPRMVERIVPTDSYETDGQVGGYIDVNQRKFSGSLAEILPAEIALFHNRALMYHKLLNEGALHFVREDIECIEEELRVLLCFVVDVDAGMMSVPADIHPDFGHGVTPYVRARALASLMIMDLARFMPREKTHVDCALYLWSSQADHVYRTEFDPLAAWSRETAQKRFEFASGLVAQAPHLFFNRVGLEAERENIAMDRDPRPIRGRAEPDSPVPLPPHGLPDFDAHRRERLASHRHGLGGRRAFQ